MTQEEITALMADSAQNAINTTREEFQLTLDGSPESIALVDDVLLSWIDRYKDSALEDNMVFTLCNIYGAYVGEVFRHRVGGNWHYDVSDPDAPYVVLEYAGKSYAFAGICYQRLVNDSQVSVKHYFDQAIGNSVQ
ncbi:hypothetical protein LJ739_04360 [Aestuariibacter halophilus]|uniref:DUF3806 domain-containing protein n=1 Tax=Fluctibacter halophilus TaxID=226011 RepID=A0ABS8G5T6_9ALTE|nr:hypothetical protein [Aestuariibacter halophilus]MCC2615471.1 hypothetical protein [Aestuariibacter halophilus]